MDRSRLTVPHARRAYDIKGWRNFGDTTRLHETGYWDYTSHGQTTRGIDPLQVDKNELDRAHAILRDIYNYNNVANLTGLDNLVDARIAALNDNNLPEALPVGIVGYRVIDDRTKNTLTTEKNAQANHLALTALRNNGWLAFLTTNPGDNGENGVGIAGNLVHEGQGTTRFRIRFDYRS